MFATHIESGGRVSKGVPWADYTIRMNMAAKFKFQKEADPLTKRRLCKNYTSGDNNIIPVLMHIHSYMNSYITFLAMNPAR